MEVLDEHYAASVQKVLDPNAKRTAKLSFTPFICDPKLWANMDKIATAYANLLEFVFQNFPVNKKIQQVLEYPKELESFIDSLNIYPKNLAAARIDVFLTNSGLQMVESNTEIPGGSEESYYLEQNFLKVYEPKNLVAFPRMEIVYKTLMTYYSIQSDYFGLPKKDKPVIYLAQWQPEIERIRGEYNVLIDFIRKQGHVCDVIDPNEILISDNKAYTPAHQQIDLIYRRFTSDELPKFAKRKWQMAIDWDKADVAIVNPFCTKRVDSKNIMVLFKDEEYEEVFPPELHNDLKTVRKIIPWTKKIKDQIVLKHGKKVVAHPYLASNKNNLIIKHANSYSSQDVFIGEDMEQKQWEQVVTESIQGDWIVQEKIDLPQINIKYLENNAVKTATCIYNVNPYIYNGKIGGLYVRASTDKLTSFKTGQIATVLPCFVQK